MKKPTGCTLCLLDFYVFHMQKAYDWSTVELATREDSRSITVDIGAPCAMIISTTTMPR